MTAAVVGAIGVQVAASKPASTMFAQQSHICGNRVGASVRSLCRGVEKLAVAPLGQKKRLAAPSTSSAGRRVAIIAAQAVSSDEAAAPAEQSKKALFLFSLYFLLLLLLFLRALI